MQRSRNHAGDRSSADNLGSHKDHATGLQSYGGALFFGCFQKALLGFDDKDDQCGEREIADHGKTTLSLVLTYCGCLLLLLLSICSFQYASAHVVPLLLRYGTTRGRQVAMTTTAAASPGSN